MISGMADVTVVPPVGPSHDDEFVRDTIGSICQFLPASRVIILDDSGCETGWRVSSTEGDSHRQARWLSGARRAAIPSSVACLSGSPSSAIRHVAETRHRRRAPRRHIRGEGRAALCGEPANRSAWRLSEWITAARHDPTVIPAWRIRRILTAEARHDPRSSPADRTIGSPGVSTQRLASGGEFVQGGATIYRAAAIRALEHAGLLDDRRLARSEMQEDHIFGLCLRSLGFEMLDFGTAYDDLPFGVTWRGLPASPEQLRGGRQRDHSFDQLLRRSRRGRHQSSVPPDAPRQAGHRGRADRLLSERGRSTTAYRLRSMLGRVAQRAPRCGSCSCGLEPNCRRTTSTCWPASTEPASHLGTTTTRLPISPAWRRSGERQRARDWRRRRDVGEQLRVACRGTVFADVGGLLPPCSNSWNRHI